MDPTPHDGAADPGSPPHRIRQYELRGRIGHGGMGVVYAAFDTLLRRSVALKFMSPELSADARARERFYLEARAAAACDHPNICTIHEIGESEEGQLFIAMAFYQGETLRKRLALGALDVAEAIDWTVQTVAGLSHLHASGLVHRDVSPANLLRTPDGTVKLIDFGLAKIESISLTSGRKTIGTIAYMSPEQLEGAHIDRRSDIWSLSVVLYEMLIGRTPFSARSAAALVRAILEDEAPDPRVLRPDVPADAARMLLAGLRKAPDERPPDVDSFAAPLLRRH